MFIGEADYDIVHIFKSLKPNFDDALSRNPLIKVEEVSKRNRSHTILVKDSGLCRRSTRFRHASILYF